MTSRPLIALAGFGRSGKDTAAAALLEAGWTRRAFADPIKALAYELDPSVDAGGILVSLRTVVDHLGWERAKDEVPGVRPYLVRLGQGGRTALGGDVWINAALRCLPDTGVVVTDCRFPNEVEAIRDLGGVVVRITRPGVGPANSDPTETSLIDVDLDHEVVNDGTVADLHRAVLAIAALRFPTHQQSSCDSCEECGSDEPVESMRLCLECLSVPLR